MKRSTWNAVLITIAVLAAAGIVPRLMSGPDRPRPPVAPSIAAAPGRAASSRATASGDDRALLGAAVRGGVTAAGAALVVIVLGWSLRARGGVRRQAIALAGRGLRTADVARRTRLSQDAVRTLLVPEVAARRRRSTT